jgi:hypothetical protein
MRFCPNSQKSAISNRRLEMKFQFDPDLDFQHKAINAVVELFEGQEVYRTNLTVAPLKQIVPERIRHE